MTLEHLRRAREELEAAQQAHDAGMGTEMMVQEVMDDLDRLITITRNNKEDDEHESE